MTYIITLIDNLNKEIKRNYDETDNSYYDAIIKQLSILKNTCENASIETKQNNNIILEQIIQQLSTINDCNVRLLDNIVTIKLKNLYINLIILKNNQLKYNNIMYYNKTYRVVDYLYELANMSLFITNKEIFSVKSLCDLIKNIDVDKIDKYFTNKIQPGYTPTSYNYGNVNLFYGSR